MGLRPDEELDLGSFELTEARPGIAPLEFDLLNHFVGFVKNWVNPVDGDADRGKLLAPGERAPGGGMPVSGGLNVLMLVDVPRLGGISKNGGG